MEQRPRQQEVLEAHGALAQKDQVRVGRQAQLAVGSERVETLRLLRGGHALPLNPAGLVGQGQGWGSAFVYGTVVESLQLTRGKSLQLRYTTSFLGGGTPLTARARRARICANAL